MQLEGHFFAVFTSDEALLQLQPGKHGSWTESGQLQLWQGGRRVHASRLGDLQEVAMGQRAGSDASPRYHFCLLFRAAEPLLLSTCTHSERRDVSASRRNTKLPCLPHTR